MRARPRAARACATAMRAVTGFLPTSTMRGRLARSKCVRLLTKSAADVIHFDLRGSRRCLAHPGAQFTVAVGAPEPDRTDALEQLLIARTAAQCIPQARA